MTLPVSVRCRDRQHSGGRIPISRAARWPVGQAEWKHLSVDNVPGSMEFDLGTNWQLACQCIRSGAGRRPSLCGGYSVRSLLLDA